MNDVSLQVAPKIRTLSRWEMWWSSLLNFVVKVNDYLLTFFNHTLVFHPFKILVTGELITP